LTESSHLAHFDTKTAIDTFYIIISKASTTTKRE